VERARALDPAYFILDFADGTLDLAAGDAGLAVRKLCHGDSQAPGIPLFMAALGVAEAAAGNATAARSELAALEKQAANSYVPGYTRALIHYALGEREAGLRELRRSFEERSGMLLDMRHTPLFDTVRKDPEAAALLARMGDEHQ